MKILALAGVLVAAVAIRRRGQRPQPDLWQQAAGEADRRDTAAASAAEPAVVDVTDDAIPPKPRHAPGG